MRVGDLEPTGVGVLEETRLEGGLGVSDPPWLMEKGEEGGL